MRVTMVVFSFLNFRGIEIIFDFQSLLFNNKNCNLNFAIKMVRCSIIKKSALFTKK